MAGFQPVANTVEIVLLGQRLGHAEVNTFYCRPISGVGPITQAMLDALLAYWAGQIVPTFLQCVSASYAASQLTARDLTQASGAQAILQLGTGFNGNRDPIANPGNCAVGCKRKTTLPGRKWHGRIELPAIGKQDTQNDTISNQLRDLIVSLLIQLAINFITSGGTNWEHVHASRSAGTAAKINGWAFNTITDSQSTRLTGHGD